MKTILYGELNFNQPIDVKIVCTDWNGVIHTHYFVFVSRSELHDTYTTLVVFNFVDIKVYVRYELRDEYSLVDY